MTAYILVDTKINNPEEYEDYKKLAKPIAEKFGGKYLARGGNMEVMENGLWTPERLVLIEFPDMTSARSFINSAEYAPVKMIRHENADCSLVIFEGA